MTRHPLLHALDSASTTSAIGRQRIVYRWILLRPSCSGLAPNTTSRCCVAMLQPCSSAQILWLQATMYGCSESQSRRSSVLRSMSPRLAQPASTGWDVRTAQKHNGSGCTMLARHKRVKKTCCTSSLSFLLFLLLCWPITLTLTLTLSSLLLYVVNLLGLSLLVSLYLTQLWLLWFIPSWVDVQEFLSFLSYLVRVPVQHQSSLTSTY